jgi:gamma-glutamylcyclotransferase (GGCT)/AIG2-like uncharacterized protein YtfP
MKTVFVYGTLKRGYSNSTLLRTATYLGDATLHGFDIHNVGNGWGFPAITPGDGTVKGELYSVDAITLSRLNSLEGVPTMYTCETVTAHMDDIEVECLVYVANRLRLGDKIESGIWEGRACV